MVISTPLVSYWKYCSAKNPSELSPKPRCSSIRAETKLCLVFRTTNLIVNDEKILGWQREGKQGVGRGGVDALGANQHHQHQHQEDQTATIKTENNPSRARRGSRNSEKGKLGGSSSNSSSSVISINSNGSDGNGIDNGNGNGNGNKNANRNGTGGNRGIGGRSGSSGELYRNLARGLDDTHIAILRSMRDDGLEARPYLDERRKAFHTATEEGKNLAILCIDTHPYRYCCCAASQYHSPSPAFPLFSVFTSCGLQDLIARC